MLMHLKDWMHRSKHCKWLFVTRGEGEGGWLQSMLIRNSSHRPVFYNSPPNQHLPVTIKNSTMASNCQLSDLSEMLECKYFSSCLLVLLILSPFLPTSTRWVGRPQLLLSFFCHLLVTQSGEKDRTLVHWMPILRLFWSWWLADPPWQPSINSWLGLPRVCYLLRVEFATNPFIMCI